MSTYVQNSTVARANLGVFVNRGIPAGEVIEKSAFIVSSNTPDDIVCHTFAGNTPDENFVVFGNCSLTNHSATEANITLRFSADASGRFMEFLATKNIVAHQELFMNYGDDTTFE